MYVRYSFAHFDPLSGEVPVSNSVGFAYVADRARRLLAGRNRSEIDTILNAVDSVIESEEQAQSGYAQAHDDQEAYYVALPLLLRFRLQTNAVPAITGAADVQASECLAVLALALIGQAALAEREDYAWYGLDPAIAEKQLQAQITGLVQEATDAIGFAEQAAYQEALRHTRKAQDRRRARRGGYAKHQADTALKELALEIYRKDYGHRGLRPSQAARYIWKRIKPYNTNSEGHPILKGMTPEATVANWIRTELKHKSSPPHTP